MIFSVWPGSGAEQFCENSLTCIYVSSSKYRKEKAWPSNFVNDVRRLEKSCELVCISTHGEARKALTDAGVYFGLILPGEDPAIKADFMERYFSAAKAEVFIENMRDNWDLYRSSCRSDKTLLTLFLSSDQYVSDLFGDAEKQKQIKAAFVKGRANHCCEFLANKYERDGLSGFVITEANRNIARRPFGEVLQAIGCSDIAYGLVGKGMDFVHRDLEGFDGINALVVFKQDFMLKISTNIVSDAGVVGALKILSETCIER